jgi:hypothetical protein
VHEDGAILLLDKTCNTTVVEHGAHPEPWHSEGCVLNILNIASVHLNLLVIFVVKNLGTGIILSKDVSRGLLFSSEDEVSLLIYFLVKSVVLELELTIKLFVLIINLSLLILY